MAKEEAHRRKIPYMRIEISLMFEHESTINGFILRSQLLTDASEPCQVLTETQYFRPYSITTFQMWLIYMKSKMLAVGNRKHLLVFHSKRRRSHNGCRMSRISDITMAKATKWDG